MGRFMALLLYYMIRETWAAATFTLVNSCGFTVWPGVLSNAGEAVLSTTGFALEPGESRDVDAPTAWSGRFWGRTICAVDVDGRFSCATGDCGSGEVECSGGGATPPVTLVEFTLSAAATEEDYYDVSLVDGYNLPVVVVPQGGGKGCGATGCAADVNGVCPEELKVVVASGSEGGEGLACRSACEAFGTPEYCCSGAYGSSQTCQPSAYSEVFKRACPMAYSYAFDDATSTFTCTTADKYIITFCPSATAAATATGSTSQKSSGRHPDTDQQPSVVSDGGNESSRLTRSNTHSCILNHLAFLIAFFGLL